MASVWEEESWLGDNVEENADEKVTSAELYSKETLNTARQQIQSFVNDLASMNLGEQSEELDDTFDNLDSTIPTITPVPSAPNVDYSLTPIDPQLDLTRPDWITDPALNFESITFPTVEMPEFSLVAPSLLFPDLPEVVWPDDPGSAPNMQDVSIPTSPSYFLPDAPTIEELDLPDLPNFSIPAFVANAPEDFLDSPGDLFVYNEEEYTSTLKDEAYDKIVADLRNGGTGLGAEIEDALWQRGRDRLDEELERGYEEIDQAWAQRGFSFPPGMLIAARQKARAEIDEKKLDLNRDITVEQARIAKEHAQFIIDKAIQMEQTLLQHFNQAADRAFQAARATAEFGIALYEAKIRAFQARLERYRTDAEIFKAQLEGELAKLQEYKIRMEGARIEADVQQRYVELYKARLSGVQILAEIYRTEMDSARLQSEVEKLKLEGYAEEVKAYMTKVQANTARYEAYQGQIQGLLGQAQVYSEQVNAYRTQVDAKKTEVEAAASEAGAKVQYNQQQIEKYKAELVEYTSIAQAYTDELKAHAVVMGAETDMAKAQVAGESARIDAETEVYKARSENARREVEMALQKAIEQGKLLASRFDVSSSSVQAAIRAQAQIASSAITAFNTTVSYGYSGSLGYSESFNKGASVSASHSFQETPIEQYIYTASA